MIEKRDFAGLRHRILRIGGARPRAFSLVYREDHRGQHGSVAVPERHYIFGLFARGVMFTTDVIGDESGGAISRELNFGWSRVTDAEKLRAELTREAT